MTLAELVKRGHGIGTIAARGERELAAWWTAAGGGEIFFFFFFFFLFDFSALRVLLVGDRACLQLLAQKARTSLPRPARIRQERKSLCTWRASRAPQHAFVVSAEIRSRRWCAPWRTTDQNGRFLL